MYWGWKGQWEGSVPVQSLASGSCTRIMLLCSCSWYNRKKVNRVQNFSVWKNKSCSAEVYETSWHENVPSPSQLQIYLQIDLLVLLWWVSALGLRFVYYMTYLEELQALEMGMVCCLFCVYVLRGVGNCTLTFWYSIPNNCCYNNHPPFNSMGEWKPQFHRLLLILCMSLFRAIYHWRMYCLFFVAFKKSVACRLYLMTYDAGCRQLKPSSHVHPGNSQIELLYSSAPDGGWCWTLLLSQVMVSDSSALSGGHIWSGASFCKDCFLQPSLKHCGDWKLISSCWYDVAWCCSKVWYYLRSMDVFENSSWLVKDLLWFGLILVGLSFFACLSFEFGVRRECVLVVCGDKTSQCSSVTLFEEIPFIHISGLVFWHCA